MRVQFTKMQGAGNDFVVLDETRARLGLTRAQYKFLADRHFGVGADQILTVRPAPSPDIDFEYVIHNADGGEVEHCGNGARCFMSFVRGQGMTTKDIVKVQTMNRVLSLQWQPGDRVTVDMGAPQFELAALPFDATGLAPQNSNSWQMWPLVPASSQGLATISVALVSMGNPHAVVQVDDVDAAPVLIQGPEVQSVPAFTRGVNVSFMQIVTRSHIHLRVYERGVGETLACGTGACAAVVCGIRLGLLDAKVDVQMRGGLLTVQWAGTASSLDASVTLTGPATTVFHGEIDIPANI